MTCHDCISSYAYILLSTYIHILTFLNESMWSTTVDEMTALNCRGNHEGSKFNSKHSKNTGEEVVKQDQQGVKKLSGYGAQRLLEQALHGSEDIATSKNERRDDATTITEAHLLQERHLALELGSASAVLEVGNSSWNDLDLHWRHRGNRGNSGRSDLDGYSRCNWSGDGDLHGLLRLLEGGLHVEVVALARLKSLMIAVRVRAVRGVGVVGVGVAVAAEVAPDDGSLSSSGLALVEDSLEARLRAQGGPRVVIAEAMHFHIAILRGILDQREGSLVVAEQSLSHRQAVLEATRRLATALGAVDALLKQVTSLADSDKVALVAKEESGLTRNANRLTLQLTTVGSISGSVAIRMQVELAEGAMEGGTATVQLATVTDEAAMRVGGSSPGKSVLVATVYLHHAGWRRRSRQLVVHRLPAARALAHARELDARELDARQLNWILVAEGRVVERTTMAMERQLETHGRSDQTNGRVVLHEGEAKDRRHRRARQLNRLSELIIGGNLKNCDQRGAKWSRQRQRERASTKQRHSQ